MPDFHSGISTKTKFLPLLLIICASITTNVFSATEDPEAQFNLGVAYDIGRGAPLDDKEAVKWYRLAAEKGHVKAQFNLAIRYHTGNDIPEDNVMAYVWINLAGANGQEATKARKIIEGRLSQEDKTESQKLSKQLMKDYPNVY